MKSIPTQLQRSIAKKTRRYADDLEMQLMQSEVRVAAVLQRRENMSRSEALRASFKLHRSAWGSLGRDGAQCVDIGLEYGDEMA